MIGSTLAHYRILEKIGAGGMGEVYRARDTRLQRDVAVKVLPAAHAADPVRQSRFEREALAVAALRHPNVVTIHAVEKIDGVAFLVMELVEGQPLSHAIPPDGFGAESFLPIAVAIADALAAAHARGITHRDLKPANVMLDADGRPRVLDFGLARFDEDSDDGATRAHTDAVTRDGQLLGTVLYMSPEQARGETVDARSDVFSAGVLFYEALTGLRPFEGTSTVDSIGKLLHAAPGPLPPSVPADLAALVMRCLEKDPARRPADGAHLLKALRGIGKHPAAARGTNGGADADAATVASDAAAGSAPAPTPLSRVRSVAVMPFASRAKGDEETEFLCDGLTESLIDALARVRALRVLSSRATFALRDADPDPVALGQRLGADAIVFGRLARSPERMMVSAELVSAVDGGRLWGARYDRATAEAAGLEFDVADNIARQLLRELSTGDSSPVPRPEIDPNAYMLYLKARPLMVGTAVQMQMATEYLEQAVQLDPDYAVAHSALAVAYVHHGMHSVRDAADARRRARAAADRAMELDPELPEAHTAAGLIRFHFDWDWEGADREYRRAVEVGPGRDLPHLEYSEFLTGIGRLDDALEQARLAFRADPVTPNSPHAEGYALMLMGRYEEAEAKFRHAIAQHPNWTWGQIKIARTYTEMGRFDDALKHAGNAEAMLHGAGTPLANSWLGYVYGRVGHEDRARRILKDIENVEHRYVDPITLAYVHCGLGEKERALELLERAYLERSPLGAHMRAIELLMPTLELGQDPRFQAILARMEYPALD